MAHARYIGRKDPATGEVPDDEHQMTRVFGHKFVIDQWADISGLPEGHQVKLKGHPSFEYADEAPKGAEPVPGKDAKAKA